MTREFTGRHMAAIMLAFFGVVIAVNLVMARLASSTFGGVVVENSYVASQHFNRWLDEADAEKALGWQAAVRRRDDGRLVVTLTGVPAGATVTAEARHPLGRMADKALTFVPQADGSLVSAQTLPVDRWRLRLAVTALGRTWRAEEILR